METKKFKDLQIGDMLYKLDIENCLLFTGNIVTIGDAPFAETNIIMKDGEHRHLLTLLDYAKEWNSYTYEGYVYFSDVKILKKNIRRMINRYVNVLDKLEDLEDENKKTL